MIDRKQFLELCQKCSVLHEGAMRIKLNVPDDLKVILDGIEYYPVAYRISFSNDGKPQHIAIIHDLKANSVVECGLDKIKLFKEN